MHWASFWSEKCNSSCGNQVEVPGRSSGTPPTCPRQGRKRATWWHEKLSVRDGDRVAERVLQHRAVRAAFVEDAGGGSGPSQWGEQPRPCQTTCLWLQRLVTKPEPPRLSFHALLVYIMKFTKLYKCFTLFLSSFLHLRTIVDPPPRGRNWVGLLTLLRDSLD